MLFVLREYQGGIRAPKPKAVRNGDVNLPLLGGQWNVVGIKALVYPLQVEGWRKRVLLKVSPGLGERI